MGQADKGREWVEKGKDTDRENKHQYFVPFIVKIGCLHKGCAGQRFSLFGTLGDGMRPFEIMNNLIRARWVRWWLIRRVWMLLSLHLLLRRHVTAVYGWHVTERRTLWRDARRKRRGWLRCRICIWILLGAGRVRSRGQGGCGRATGRGLRLIWAALGIRGDIGVSGNGKEVDVTYEAHIVYFAVQRRDWN